MSLENGFGGSVLYSDAKAKSMRCNPDVQPHVGWNSAQQVDFIRSQLGISPVPPNTPSFLTLSESTAAR